MSAVAAIVSLSLPAGAATAKHADPATTTSHPESTATTRHPAPSTHPTAPFTGKITCHHVPPSQPAVAAVPVRVSTLSRSSAVTGQQTTSTTSGTASSGGKLVTVGVCIGKSGPYPFVVDTGSTRSIIASGLASSLHLKRSGTIALGGSGCATTGRLVKTPVLHLKAVAIAPQQMVSANLSSWSGARVDGVLGSDILGRFGAIKLDLTKHALTFPGAEGPGPVSHALIIGKVGANPPASLLTGLPAAQVPLTIVQSPGSIAAFTNVSVANQGPYPFLVDTGSPSSSISAVTGLHLAVGKKTGTAPGGVGCTATVPTLVPTSVTMGSAPPSTLALHSVKITGPQRTGIVGALGLDMLGTYGAIIVDYEGASLTLVSG
jgi:Aspartyl protease